MNIIERYCFIILIGVTLISCKKSDITTIQEPQAVSLEVPVNFPAYTDDLNNPLTREGIELGRLLFYDKRLSGNNQISCASCHKQSLSFSDGIALNNIGVSGNVLHRNAPALVNMAWAKNGLFWDGGSTNLESQALGPLTSVDEMHQDLYQLVNELKAVENYVVRFKSAFKSDISDATIMKALAQFQRTIVSSSSRYDKYKRGETGGNLTDSELQGLILVQQKCQSCHKGDLFTDNEYHNNGLDDDFSNNSLEGIYQGRYRVTFNTADLGKFKTPTLRNVMLTAPYMHDGRFTTVQQVLDHYSNGIKVSPSLAPSLNPFGIPAIPLSSTDKANIIAFLKTLTDSSFINNPKLSKPQ
jgi:cytochrome c peroxidase